MSRRLQDISVQRGVDCAHIILPAYNEACSLQPLLCRLSELSTKLTEKLIVWVIDDGSEDETAEIALSDISGLNIRLVQHPMNMGLGSALCTGLQSVAKEAGDNDVIIVMDADDTHDVLLIPKMIEQINIGNDIVIASRFVSGGDDSTAPLFRRGLSRGASWVFRFLFPLEGFKDFTSGYRAYSANIIHKANQYWGQRLIVERGFACMVELMLKLRHWNPRVKEVPLVLRYDRKGSESKLKLVRTIRQYLILALRDRLSPAPNILAYADPLDDKSRYRALA